MKGLTYGKRPLQWTLTGTPSKPSPNRTSPMIILSTHISLVSKDFRRYRVSDFSLVIFWGKRGRFMLGGPHSSRIRFSGKSTEISWQKARINIQLCQAKLSDEMQSAMRTNRSLLKAGQRSTVQGPYSLKSSYLFNWIGCHVSEKIVAKKGILRQGIEKII